MLKTITWEEFGTALLPLLIIYYLYVLLKYYKHELVLSCRNYKYRGQK